MTLFKKASPFVLLIAFVIGSFATLSSVGFHMQTVHAYETECPSYITDDEQCLAFLQDQQSRIREEQDRIKDSISAENTEQMSLSEQISYLASKIEETELNIAEKEVAIEKKNVEVRILGEDILAVQTSIDTLTQEINRLESTMKKRTKTSYKMTFMSPLEILLDSKNLETMMRRMKYLIEVKKKDRTVLIDMSVSRNELADQEEILAEKRQDVQTKRNEIESERADLAEERTNLESQKGQQQTLLAESQRREQEYQESLVQLKGVQNQIDAQVTDLIMKLWQEGQLGVGTPVAKGAIVGFQGHTGCSFGSHLHFSINWGAVNPFSRYLTGGSLYQPVGSGTAQTPLDGAVLSQTFHMGMAIDMYSASSGSQSGDYYYASKGSISCSPSFEGWLSLRGEGAPVRSILSGTVFTSKTDYYGGKYVVVDHGNGLTSLYLHLR